MPSKENGTYPNSFEIYFKQSPFARAGFQTDQTYIKEIYRMDRGLDNRPY